VFLRQGRHHGEDGGAHGGQAGLKRGELRHGAA
jgi:hypothetical protein